MVNTKEGVAIATVWVSDEFLSSMISVMMAIGHHVPLQQVTAYDVYSALIEACKERK
jgi:hypothetical protein